MYAIICNPQRIETSSGVVWAGRILSKHRTLEATSRAFDHHQEPTRRASPGSHLDLLAVELVDPHHGKSLGNNDEWLTVRARTAHGKRWNP